MPRSSSRSSAATRIRPLPPQLTTAIPLPSPATRSHLRQAQLLERVFAIDLVAYPYCGARLTLIGAIEAPGVIAKILTHRGCLSELSIRLSMSQPGEFQAVKRELRYGLDH